VISSWPTFLGCSYLMVVARVVSRSLIAERRSARQAANRLTGKRPAALPAGWHSGARRAESAPEVEDAVEQLGLSVSETAPCAVPGRLLRDRPVLLLFRLMPTLCSGKVQQPQRPLPILSAPCKPMICVNDRQ
jgi:hypothetical protein